MNSDKTFSTTRRSLLKGAAAVGAVLPLPGILGRARAQEDVIRILGVETAALEDWSDFTKETGLTVEFTGIHADAGVYAREIVANAAGEDYDIFIINGGMEDKLGAEYFLPLDESRIPNWPKMAESLRTSSILRTPDQTLYAVPAITNADSFAFYPEDNLGAEPLSWALLFENEATKGKVSLEDNWATTLVMAAVFLKVAKGMPIGDPANMTPEEAKAVVDFLIERKKAGQFRALWTSFDESVEMLRRKEVLVSNVWEPAVKALQREGKAVRYADTVEGYFKWMICAYAAKQVTDRGDEEKAYRALGGFLGGAYAARIAVLRGYSTGVPSEGLVYAEANGFAEPEIQSIKENIGKLDRKIGSEHAWFNIVPEHQQAIESEWDRFRQS